MSIKSLCGFSIEFQNREGESALIIVRVIISLSKSLYDNVALCLKRSIGLAQMPMLIRTRDELSQIGPVVVLTLLLSAPNIHAYPTVFPVGTTIYNAAQAYDGYTFYSLGSSFKAYLIDMNGNIVHTWDNADFIAEPLPNGNLLLQKSNEVREVDWDGNIVWRWSNLDCYMHHDSQRLENGNTLVLCHNAINILWISSKPLVDDYIVEVDPQGNVVFRWDTWKHFFEFEFDGLAKSMIYNQGLDWAHTNSIQSLPTNNLNDPRFTEGNILVSQRQTNIVFIIDKQTKEIVWKIGPSDNLTIGQHQARMITQGYDGAGQILMYDNGGFAGYPLEVRPHSRVIEINPLTNTIVRRYRNGDSKENSFAFYSPFMSGAQKLPNGNTLICEAWTGRLFEINTDNEIVWEYIIPLTADGTFEQVYRAYRVGPDWPKL